jgi:TRAP transporter TAXI family solute receptor
VFSRRAVLRGAATATVAWTAAGCQPAPAPKRRELRIATGGQGGVYYVYGQGIAEAVRRDLPELTATVLPTGASVENLRMVAAGTAELGFALADSAAAAVTGQPPFGAALAVTALARLYENYLHVVALDGGPVQRLADLAGRTASLGAPGSGTELIAGRVLATAGVRPAADLRLGVDDSARALLDGRLDAFFFSGGLPTAAISTLARAVPIRLLDVGDLVTGLRRGYGELYAERTIPASTYGLDGPVGTVGVANYLVVAALFDADVAYRLTRLLFDRRELLAAAHPEARRLDRWAAIGTYPVPLHPGAIRYYREVKR